MMVLDRQERAALNQFGGIVRENWLESPPTVEMDDIFRGPEGQIIVPVTIGASEPSPSFAMLMAHKAEHLYKQTGCRFVLAQRLDRDPKKLMYVWAEGAWRAL
jgi:hypothetical protein